MCIDYNVEYNITVKGKSPLFGRKQRLNYEPKDKDGLAVTEPLIFL